MPFISICNRLCRSYLICRSLEGGSFEKGEEEGVAGKKIDFQIVHAALVLKVGQIQ